MTVVPGGVVSGAGDKCSDESADRLQCEFFLVKKNRRCGMTRRAGSKLCSEHSKDADRVPCPLDPTHTVCSSKLRVHMRKCNKFRHDVSYKAKQREIPWFDEGLNSISEGQRDSKPADETLLKSVALIVGVFEAEFGGKPPLPLIEKRNEFLERTERYKTLVNRKHARQQSSLIQHLKDSQLWPNSDPLASGKTLEYIELGCGRAEFSRYVNIVANLDQPEFTNDATEGALRARAQAPSFTLVDRASQRLRFDNKFSSDVDTEVEIRREKIDIKDLKLDVILHDASEYVAISKHLCGVATDLSLRCLLNSNKCKGNLKGILIAMCCRHVCQSSEYVNQEYIEELLKKHGNPKSEAMTYTEFFQCLKKFCSYCTCGLVPDKDPDGGAEDHVTRLTHNERQRIGHMARRILDEGRAQFLQSRGFQTSLFKYVDNSVTLEDTALLALRV
ncbi:unnamed protein product [Kluyveromyces dobzhanskii CBS 2104]|uniref:tRNA:m(4)X modification enzyme TRM13 n=1 Tax=Kluyveromyces dobzhanskii CBS 2104 TaxID=1427455 RepID=A0A0A8L8L4_9SACH|nr:unnamed protein product [Kluyveromyces dobzhanskii CBS 2104]